MLVANFIEEARIGGPQIRNLMVAKAINKKNKITIIFSNKNSIPLKKKSELSKIKYITLPLTTIKRGFIGLSKYIIFFPFEVLMIAWVFKKNKFDLVHVSGGCWQTKGIFAAKIAGIKVVWELNDTFAPKIVKNTFYYLSSLANSYIFASEKTKMYYKNFFSNHRKNFIIQSPVDTEKFDPKINYENNFFLQNSNNEKKIIIGTVANISPVKNIEMIIGACKKLSNYSDKIIFFIVGSLHFSQKNYYKKLNEIIKNYKIKNFFFLDSKDDIRPLISFMDIYLCTSKFEASPLSVWEAMSMEKAIISTDVGDVAKFIDNGSNGFIVRVGDISSLVKRIEELIKNPKLREEFGKVSRHIAKNKLDIEICANQHIKAYKEITNCNV